MDCIIFEECPKDINGKRNGKAYKYVNVGEKYLTHTIEYIDDKLISIDYMYNMYNLKQNFIKLYFKHSDNDYEISKMIIYGNTYKYFCYLPCNNEQYYLKNDNTYDIFKFYIPMFEPLKKIKFTFNNFIVDFDFSEFI